MERPAPRLIRTPTDAEHAACAWMQHWGFVDSFVSGGGGPDGGVDVESTAAVAQVKAEMRPVSRPVVQQTFGIAAHEGKRAFVFGLSGFTEEAIAWGDEAGVALFGFDLTGEPQPINTTAFAFAEAAAKGEATAVARESYPRVVVWDPLSPESDDLGLVLGEVFAPYVELGKAAPPIMFYGPVSTDAEATQVLRDVWVREVNRRYGSDTARVVEARPTGWDSDAKLAAFITNVEAGDTIYIERLDEMPEQTVDVFVRAITTFQMDIVVGKGPAERRILIDLPPFFVLGATDNPGRLPDKLRNVFETWIVRPFTEPDKPFSRFR